MSLTESEVINNPDKVLNDKNKLKELVENPYLVVKYLEAKNSFDERVEVGGKTVYLVRTPSPPFTQFSE